MEVLLTSIRLLCWSFQQCCRSEPTVSPFHNHFENAALEKACKEALFQGFSRDVAATGDGKEGGSYLQLRRIGLNLPPLGTRLPIRHKAALPTLISISA